MRIGGVVGSRTRNGELSLTLQESSVGVDELVRLDITNRDTGHVGGICRESESSGVEGAGDVEVARSLSPNEDIERDFRALLASVAGARALGSMFRRSRDIKWVKSTLATLSLAPQWLAKVVTTCHYSDPGGLAVVYRMSFILAV